MTGVGNYAITIIYADANYSCSEMHNGMVIMLVQYLDMQLANVNKQ